MSRTARGPGPAAGSGALVFTLLAFLSPASPAACGGGTAKSSGPAASGAGKIFVTVYGSDQVEVFDATSHAPLTPIPLGSGRGPAIILKTPDGKKLYTANWKDSTISAIGLAATKVTTID
ncbi:MAG TPA: hypothetical protein VH044_02355, partial [Polyangiaceae bacterium]|nr:hypothetical protein [Polyangiaceae bacterium]